MPNYFHSMQSKISERDAEIVDARSWTSYWRKRWVVYADLLGFADISDSRDNTANVILRFHKCVELARQETKPERLFQFTDACYAICDDLGRAISCAISIQHFCLAMNEWRVKRAGALLFHELLVPRITVAQGDVLSVDSPEGLPGDAADLVRPEHLLAGHGIVNAYRLEKLAAGPQIAIWTEALPEIRKLKVRGATGAVRTAVEHWLKEPSPGRKHGKSVTARVVQLPWPLLRVSPGEPLMLWADERPSVESKLRSMLVVWRSNFHQFIVQHGDPSVMKHYAGALQLTEYCLRNMDSVQGKGPMDAAQMHARLFRGRVPRDV